MQLEPQEAGMSLYSQWEAERYQPSQVSTGKGGHEQSWLGLASRKVLWERQQTVLVLRCGGVGSGGKRPQFPHSEWLLGGEHYLA